MVRWEPAVIVDAAKRATGETTNRGLARQLARYGFDPVSTADAIGRWNRGETQPEYAPTLALLELAGWLNVDRAAAPLEDAAAAARRAAEAARHAVDREERPPMTREHREAG